MPQLSGHTLLCGAAVSISLNTQAARPETESELFVGLLILAIRHRIVSYPCVVNATVNCLDSNSRAIGEYVIDERANRVRFRTSSDRRENVSVSMPRESAKSDSDVAIG